MDTLHSDNGLEFENTILKHICEWTGAVKTHTTPYHPQGNGTVERMNRTLKEMITCLCRDHQSSWSDELPFALWAVRSCISRATGFSPFQVLFGQAMQMPFDYQTWNPDTSSPLYTEYVTKLVEHLKTLHERIAESNKSQQLKAKLQHDKGSLDRTFEPGQLVLVRELHLPHELAVGEKFYPKWRGPYEVLVAFSPTTYRLRHCSEKTEMTAHVNNIKVYHTVAGDTTDLEEDDLSALFVEVPPTTQGSTTTQGSMTSTLGRTTRSTWGGTSDALAQDGTDTWGHDTTRVETTAEKLRTCLNHAAAESSQNNSERSSESTNSDSTEG
jgi:hypothetical protein